MITQQELKTKLYYDQDCGIFIWTKSGKRAGCEHSLGYRIVRVNGKPYKEHRLAWLYVYGEFPIKDLDHINRVKNDNKIINLRIASESENGQNMLKAQSHSKTGVLGVSPIKNKFVASIQVGGIKKYLGRFDTISEASEAYLSEKKVLHPFCAMDYVLIER